MDARAVVDEVRATVVAFSDRYRKPGADDDSVLSAQHRVTATGWHARC
jgi:hypothetical protein